MLTGFETDEIQTGETSIFVRWSGSGPPILLYMGSRGRVCCGGAWPLLARQFRSSVPTSAASAAAAARLRAGSWAVREAGDGARHGGRHGAARLSRFSVAGHDRGGRVAFRRALDIRAGSSGLRLDILPTATVWERADAQARARLVALVTPGPACTASRALPSGRRLTPWSMPLGGWGSPSGRLCPGGARGLCRGAARSRARPRHIREEYRAAATLDRRHDEADSENGRRIACPLLALWSGAGALGEWYAEAGGPLALWRHWSDDVRGGPLDAGHFFPEEIPDETTDALSRFLS